MSPFCPSACLRTSQLWTQALVTTASLVAGDTNTTAQTGFGRTSMPVQSVKLWVVVQSVKISSAFTSVISSVEVVERLVHWVSSLDPYQRKVAFERRRTGGEFP